MKLAIIGSGPIALFCAQHFDQIGAEVALFQKNPLGGNIRFLKDHFPKMELAINGETFTVESFWNNKLIAVVEELESKQITKAGEVLRVHKRFLHPKEVIQGRSRLLDLFRVIYSVNPREAILKQLEENPEMFKQLGEQVVNSLHTPVESFEDFDIVIEVRGRGRESNPMGPSNALALNENNIRQSNQLLYEKDIFTKLSFEGKKHLVLIGDDESAVLALIKCKEWIFSHPSHSLSWVTHSPVSKKFENQWLNNELEKILSESQVHFDRAKTEFEKKMHEWRDLEDYEKVKIPKPIEPEAKLKIFQGYDVTSVDRLLDREGVFATIETPDFRSHADGAHQLKTLPADTIIVACGVKIDDRLSVGLTSEEPGYYCLVAEDLNQGMMLIKDIEEKIMSYFSRAQT